LRKTKKEACPKDKPLKDKINEEVVELPAAADLLEQALLEQLEIG